MVRIVLSLFVLLSLSMQAGASETWRVARVLGQAWIINPDRSLKPVTAGAVVEDGQTVSTSGTGRVMLVKGAASMLVGPDSSMAVQPNPNADGRTVVIQRAGTVDFQVEKRDVRYFSVETPYLAAVVKGTHFKVAVAGKGASVKVSHGLVLIDGFRAGQTTMLPAGQMVHVRQNGKLVVSGSGRKYHIISSARRPALVAAADGTTQSAAATTSAAADGSTTDADDADTDDDGNGKAKGKADKADKADKGDKGNSGNGKGKGDSGNGGGNGNGNNGNGNGNGGSSGNGNGNGGGKGNGGGNGNGGGKNK